MKQTESTGISRRHFAMAGLSAGAALLAPGALFAEGIQPLSGKAQPADLPTIKPGTNTSFHSLKQIDAGLLNIGYAEDGPADGPAVILLHGWPHDLCRCCPLVGIGGVQGDRPVSARVWHDALSFQ
jgi:hypothetical protein